MDDLGVPLFEETFIFTYITIFTIIIYIIAFIENIQPSYINILYSKYHPLVLEVFRFLRFHSSRFPSSVRPRADPKAGEHPGDCDHNGFPKWGTPKDAEIQ